MASDLNRMTVSRLRAGAVATLAALALAVTTAAPASATTAPAPLPTAFALSAVGTDGAFLVRCRPGGILDDAVRVRNLLGHPITVILQTADIENAANGNADYDTARVSQAGRWLHLAASVVRLGPYASRPVPFTVHVPPSATGASHYAGIVATDAADLATAAHSTPGKGHTFTFSRITRQALPVTIRLPGPLSRALALSSVDLTVQPAGSQLVLGLRVGGSELIEGAHINLRVRRGRRTTFTYYSTLGQLFPDATLNYQIPWIGQLRHGTYHVVGSIRPQGAGAVKIDRTVEVSAATAAQVKHDAAATSRPSRSSIPTWVWLTLGLAAALLVALSTSVWKLTDRAGPPTTDDRVVAFTVPSDKVKDDATRVFQEPGHAPGRGDARSRASRRGRGHDPSRG